MKIKRLSKNELGDLEFVGNVTNVKGNAASLVSLTAHRPGVTAKETARLTNG